MKIGADSVLLGAWMDVDGAERLLDAGCGCGILALMAAQKLSDEGVADYRIDAVDIDAGAVADSAANFAASPWAAHLNIRQVSLQDFADELSGRAADAAAGGYDHIFCNPPYYDASPTSGSESRDAARRTDTLSRADLLSATRRLLKPDGRLSLILPVEQGKKFIYEATVAGWGISRQCFVKTAENLPAKRLMLELSPMAALRADIATLTVGSADYAALTAPFYL